MTESTDINITVVQSALHWENRSQNLQHFTAVLSEIKTGDTDIIVLPEMFTTGFTMSSKEVAEPENGPTLQWMLKLATSKNACIVGSVIIEDNNQYFNRLFWAFPNGDYRTYNKRHLFRFAGENNHFAPGKERLIVEHKGWRFCPLVCFDLRFPVFSRNTDFETGKNPVYDCIIYVANWPAARKSAWSTLLEARAHENQSYVIGVNRVGKDGKDISYSGNSVVIEPKGSCISSIKENEEKLETITLNKKDLENFREKFPVGLDADGFSIKS